MLDLQNEKLLRLHDARRLPWLRGRSGGSLDIGTLRRWALRGCRGVQLETARIGGTTYTSEEAVVRFIERLSAGECTTPTPSTKHRRAIAAAEHRLDAAGL